MKKTKWSKVKVKWTKEKVLKFARKFKRVGEWKNANNFSYQLARTKNFLPEATKHMKPIGNRVQRCIYYIKIKKEKSIYIGLTYNFDRRIRDHLNSKRFAKYKKNSLIIKQLTDYIKTQEASKLEIKLMKEYQEKKYNLLNLTGGGGVGSGFTFWNRKKIIETAKKYDQISKWQHAEQGAYQAACQNKKILKDATAHMKKRNVWSKKNVLRDSLKYKTKRKWAEKSSSAYTASLKNKWHKEATAHMCDGNIIWTKEKTLKNALKYKTRKDWKLASRGAHEAAYREGWVKEATAHMKKFINQYK